MSRYDYKRQQMVKNLSDLGIADQRVLSVMAQLPRHYFVPKGIRFQAYDEKALPIGYEQTISHPYTVARMSELLDIKPGDKILEIGTGSGYQCAVLSMLGARVFSVEILTALAERAEKVLNDLGCNVALKKGNGRNGWLAYAPYDRIIVTAGTGIIPAELLNQVAEKGRLLIPVGDQENQVLRLIMKNGNELDQQDYDQVTFVPLTGDARGN